jgi:hypothetical protein
MPGQPKVDSKRRIESLRRNGPWLEGQRQQGGPEFGGEEEQME